MKKITLLLGLAFLMFSCSSDDGDDNSSSSILTTDVVGEWRLISETEDGEVIALDDCDLMNTIVFTETELSQDFYRESNSFDEEVESECIMSFSIDFPYFLEDNLIVSTDEGEEGDEGFVSVTGDQLIINDEEFEEGELVFGSVRVFERVTE